jgi:hypothetical protein
LDYETLNVKALKSGEVRELQVHKDFTEIHVLGK